MPGGPPGQQAVDHAQQGVADGHHGGDHHLADAEEGRQEGGQHADDRPGGDAGPGGEHQEDAVDQGAGDELLDAEGAEDGGDAGDPAAQELGHHHQGHAHGGDGDPLSGILLDHG